VSDVLSRIVAGKREEIARAKAARGLAELERAARAAPPPRGFIAALAAAVAA
jgi:indole-3-glycerol phosphate synthase